MSAQSNPSPEKREYRPDEPCGEMTPAAQIAEARRYAGALWQQVCALAAAGQPLPRPNYQKTLEKELEKLVKTGRRPSLLLHSCCAPCSSYVLEYLSRYYTIFLLYYNPNIAPPAEYYQRLAEVRRLVAEMPLPGRVEVMDGRYEPEVFTELVCQMQGQKEGGQRCLHCYALRLGEAARAAKKLGCDTFTTTLTISPHKNAWLLGELGRAIGGAYGVPYLLADFKKREGFKRSIALSARYGLYRQDFCGCPPSKREARERNKDRPLTSE